MAPKQLRDYLERPHCNFRKHVALQGQRGSENANVVPHIKGMFSKQKLSLVLLIWLILHVKTHMKDFPTVIFDKDFQGNTVKPVFNFLNLRVTS